MNNPVLVVLGTRPEVIKLRSVIEALEARHVNVCLCHTGQHGVMTDQHLVETGRETVLRGAPVPPSITSLSVRAAALAEPIEHAITSIKPALVLVEGDTASAFMGALTAFHAGVRVAHVEAGLRTDCPTEPFPEEMYRRLITRMATLHFAPTWRAQDNLRQEGIAPDAVRETGNPGIDELVRLLSEPKPVRPAFGDARVILITCHRREQCDARLSLLIDAVLDLARDSTVRVLWPVHPNPAVRTVIWNRLGHLPTVKLFPPMSHAWVVEFLVRADVVITDSGGVIEEATALRRPTFIIRDRTERPEALFFHRTSLVPLSEMAELAALVRTMLDEHTPPFEPPICTVFGDGRAGERIADIIADYLHE